MSVSEEVICVHGKVRVACQRCAARAVLVGAAAGELERGDRALVRFLNERAGSAAAVTWRVDVDGEDEWFVRLWVGGLYTGRWRITVEGSELTDATDAQVQA